MIKKHKRYLTRQEDRVFEIVYRPTQKVIFTASPIGIAYKGVYPNPDKEEMMETIAVLRELLAFYETVSGRAIDDVWKTDFDFSFDTLPGKQTE